MWDAVEGGSVTAVSVASPGGVAVRLAVAFGSLPAGSEVRFFAPGADSQVFGPVTPEQIRALTLPAEAGDPGVDLVTRRLRRHRGHGNLLTDGSGA